MVREEGYGWELKRNDKLVNRLLLKPARASQGGDECGIERHSPPCKGGVDAPQKMVPFRKGADGVVAHDWRFAMRFKTFAYKEGKTPARNSFTASLAPILFS